MGGDSGRQGWGWWVGLVYRPRDGVVKEASLMSETSLLIW